MAGVVEDVLVGLAAGGAALAGQLAAGVRGATVAAVRVGAQDGPRDHGRDGQHDGARHGQGAAAHLPDVDQCHASLGRL